jgi:transposase InsO family protein
MKLISDLYPSIHECTHKHICDICHFAKQKKLSFPDSTSCATTPFSLLHMDIWGPYRVPTLHNQCYFLTIVDDYSRHTWIIFLKHKSQTQQCVEAFLSMIYTQFKVMHSLFEHHGIIHQTSCVETPQQNGRVERKHQQILNIAKALLFQARLPKGF